jgi:hypothetical protein
LAKLPVNDGCFKMSADAERPEPAAIDRIASKAAAGNR